MKTGGGWGRGRKSFNLADRTLCLFRKCARMREGFFFFFFNYFAGTAALQCRGILIKFWEKF